MARPSKIGLDYFPLDVDFFQDEKILAISGEFAVKGEIITLRILCEIYRNGYFVEYSGLLKNKLARLGGLSAGLVDEVVKKLVEYNFFNGEIFREHKILTSQSIQETFYKATERRKNVEISDYWLIKGVNVDINTSSNGVNVDINTQSKVKESKVKESESSGNAPEYYPPDHIALGHGPDKNEVLRHFASFGIKDPKLTKMAKSFYTKWDATNWSMNGSKIQNWTALANRFIDNWEDIESKQDQTNNVNPAYQPRPLKDVSVLMREEEEYRQQQLQKRNHG